MKADQMWFDVVAPEFNNLNIGSIYGTESNVVGRKIKIQTTEIKELKQRAGYSLTFVINEVAEKNTCKAAIETLELSREQLSKFVKHGIRKIDLSFKINLGGKDYAIKIVFSIRKTYHRYITYIVKTLEQIINEKIKDYDLKKLIVSIMDEKIQTDIKKELNKIYPIKALEIRMVSPYKG